MIAQLKFRQASISIIKPQTSIIQTRTVRSQACGSTALC